MSCGSCNSGKCGRPREEMNLSPSGLLELIRPVLSAIENSPGLTHYAWGIEDISRLIDTLSAVMAENDRLKKLLRPSSPDTPLVTIENESVRVNFGPDNKYSLMLPASTLAQRKQLAESLTAAAIELRRKPTLKQSLPNQLPLPFDQ